MWTFETTPIAQDGLQYHLFKNGRTLSFADVIYKWKEQPDFRHFYNNTLAQAPFEAFYWEHPAVLRQDLDKLYEFVLLPAESLLYVTPEPQQFQQYFISDSLVRCFYNLGGDAKLVVPCPIEGKSYPHLAEFVRNAPTNQIDAFWALVGASYGQALGEGRKWLSTAGLGVYWLHVRIDSRPKYYKWGKYR